MEKRADPLHRQLCFALDSANNAMGRLYRPMLNELGLTYPQYLVLLALWEQDHQTVSMLGKALYLESNTLTPLLKRMEGSDLVRRVRSLEDERSVSVSLTETGKSLEEKAHDIGICVTNVAGKDGLDVAAFRDELLKLAERLRS